MLTIIILNFNTKDLLKKCLESIFVRKWKHTIQVVVVDNASTDNSTEMIKKLFPRVELIQSRDNLGFSGGNNLGLKKVSSKYVLLLNSDTEVLENSLDNLLSFMERTNFDIGSCKLLNKDRSFQPNAGDLPFGLPLFFWLSGWDDILPFVRRFLPSFHRKFSTYYFGEREVGWVSGSVMIIKNEVIKKIGLFDETIFMYGEDVEYCIRAKRAGFKVGWTDKAQIMHLGGGSSKDPSIKQWIGEFRGLLYIYRKYLGNIASFFLGIFIRIFIAVRAFAFLTIGRSKAAKTYAKIIFSL